MLTCCFASFDLYLHCVSSWSNICISVFSVVWVLPPWNWTRNWIFRLTLQTLRLLTAPVRLRTPDRRPCWTSGLLGLSDSSALSWESWEETDVPVSHISSWSHETRRALCTRSDHVSVSLDTRRSRTVSGGHQMTVHFSLMFSVTVHGPKQLWISDYNLVV